MAVLYLHFWKESYLGKSSLKSLQLLGFQSFLGWKMKWLEVDDPLSSFYLQVSMNLCLYNFCLAEILQELMFVK